MGYQLSLENYQGPLEKLLELIEERELEVTRVNLAQVTGDFFAYIETLRAGGVDDPQVVADFLVVASKLILIKSKALLPTLEVTEEEEADMRDLERRLVLYREFKKAQQHLKEGWSITPRSWSREFLQTSEPLFYPPRAVTPATLAGAVQVIVGELARLLKPTSTIRTDIINLKEKIEEVLKRLTEVPRKFASLHTGSRSEVVVLFLAVLHLIKEQLISVDQDSHFSEMTIVKKAPAA
jgi:segregation and condensation protein A